MPLKSVNDSSLIERIASLETDMSWVKKMHFIEILMLIITLVKLLTG